MNFKISPSIICADFLNLSKQIKILENLKVDYIHFDVMDGHFVPNFSMGPDILSAIRKITRIPIDLHLMVENPEKYIDMFSPQKMDIVTIHQESTELLVDTINRIKNIGAKAGVAINPSTDVCKIRYILDKVDVVLIMGVNPGFIGQTLIPSTLKKISKLKEIREQNNLLYQIEVDGNVSFQNARKMRLLGADIFVAGTSSLFNSDYDIEIATDILKKSIF